MGGVCPCLAGVEKAAAKPEAPKAPAAEKKNETQPLLELKTAAPAAVAADPAPAPKPAREVAVVAPAPQVQETTPEPAGAPTETVAGLAAAQALGIGSCLEIYSNSYKAWCPGVIYGLDSEAVLVAYQVPGEPADANISTKTLPVDSTELQVPQPEGAWRTASVEVYSHSNKAWCLGKVTEIIGGVLSVVFFYPNEPADAVPVMKQLPLGDKDLRLRGIDAAFHLPTAGIGHETLQVNNPVEVYSNSLAVWCPGVVEAINEAEGIVTVAFYYPDMDPSKEQPAVKELPLGHQDLRLPGTATGAPHNEGPPVTEADLQPGGEIEVFSSSRQVWILATVKDTVDGMVTIQMRYPDMPPGSDLYEKVLPVGHGDMRLPVAQ